MTYPHLVPKSDLHGRRWMPEVESFSGHAKVTVAESMNQGRPTIWLEITGCETDLTAFLTIDAAIRLTQQIEFLVRNHSGYATAEVSP